MQEHTLTTQICYNHTNVADKFLYWMKFDRFMVIEYTSVCYKSSYCP